MAHLKNGIMESKEIKDSNSSKKRNETTKNTLVIKHECAKTMFRIVEKLFWPIFLLFSEYNKTSKWL